ncbi:MAG: COG1361 S-layer family protein [Nanoarchaeota archaeon]
MKKIILSVILFLVVTAIVYAVEYESPSIKVTLLNQDPSPARAGDTVELRLRVENTGGGTVQNLEIEAVQNYPFTVIDSPALQNLGTLYAYQTAKNYINTQYKLKIDKDALKGKHELKVKYKYDNQEWVAVSFNIDVTSKEFAQIIYVDKAKIEPGKETEMKFTITNIGNAPLQNMVFSWSEADGVILPVFSDDTKYIKYLDVSDSIELKYIVIADVNAQPGLYQLDLSLKYESLTNTTSTVIKTKAGVFVGGETDFDVAFSESTQGQTSLSVANTGNNPALSVSVRIPEQSNFRVTGSNSAIIGNLDKGDYTIVSFQIGSSGMANFTGIRQRQSSQNVQSTREVPGTSNNLKVKIDYTDTTGERRSVEKNVPIQFRASTGDTSSGTLQSGQFQRTQQTSFWQSKTFYIPAIIIVLVIGFVLYINKGWREVVLSVVKKRK